MKRKLLLTFAMAAALLAVVSCKDDKETPSSLDCQYTGNDVSSAGGTAIFEVKSNVDWSVGNADSWITKIEPSGGKSDAAVIVTFAPNTDLQERSSTFTVKGGDLTKTVVIKQKGGEEFVSAEYTGEAVSAAGGTATFTVKSNVGWKVSNDDGWITNIAPREGSEDGSVTVTFAPNTEMQERGSTFTVTGDNGKPSDKVVITQQAAGESLTIEYLGDAVSADGGTVTFTVKSNMDWTVFSSDAWITEIEPDNGTGDADVTVTIEANDTTDVRMSSITVEGGSLTETLKVPQSAGMLPDAAGAITESDASPTSVVLNIAEIGGARTYRWYRDGAEVQDSESRTYTAIESGTYKVAGVNIVGEGAASPDHEVTLNAVALEDYLGDYVFNVTFVNPKNTSSTWAAQYEDTMTVSPEDGIDIRFSNATDQHSHRSVKQDVYIDFIYDEGSGGIAYSDKYTYKLQGYNSVKMFVPFIFVGTDVVFVNEMEIKLNLDTGELAFPTELTHPDHGTAKAYYTNWSWNADTKASEGRLSTNYMTNVVATKKDPSPSPAPPRPSQAGDRIVSIPVKIAFPEGFDLNTPVKDEEFIPD